MINKTHRIVNAAVDTTIGMTSIVGSANASLEDTQMEEKKTTDDIILVSRREQNELARKGLCTPASRPSSPKIVIDTNSTVTINRIINRFGAAFFRRLKAGDQKSKVMAIRFLATEISVESLCLYPILIDFEIKLSKAMEKAYGVSVTDIGKAISLLCAEDGTTPLAWDKCITEVMEEFLSDAMSQLELDANRRSSKRW